VDFDYVIVGAGFFGSICAHELTKRGKRVVVLEKRSHIGGNLYTENRDGINVHVYGPHVFHTSDEEIWNWINQFVSFNNYRVQTVAMYKGEAFSLPFSMWTFSKLWGISTPKRHSR
jgi:UDP-galactopyranose mutase